MLVSKNHINPGKVISAGLVGTTFMTLFSYLVSEMQKENFKEPELLGKMLNRLIPQFNSKTSQVAGWNIHYTVGLLFAVFYAQLWEKRKRKPTLKSGILLGGLSGILAFVVWRYTFKFHPVPPKIHFRKYYGHLLVTHIVFGAFASIGYNLIHSRRLSPYPQNRSLDTE